MPPLNKPLDVHVKMVTAYLVQLETIQQMFLKGVVWEYCFFFFFVKSFLDNKIYMHISFGA